MKGRKQQGLMEGKKTVECLPHFASFQIRKLTAQQVVRYIQSLESGYEEKMKLTHNLSYYLCDSRGLGGHTEGLMEWKRQIASFS